MTDGPGAPVIRVEGMKKAFGRNQVLHGIDLDLHAGELVGFMGPNGAGKSTLIKILDGVYHADAGRLSVHGETVGSLSERPEVAFIHQDLGLIDGLSIVDNLRLGQPPLRRLGPIVNHARERAIARAALDRVHLSRPVTTPVGELAPGEKTLVAVARALDRGATIIFVDEATSTLPPSEARRVTDALKSSAAQGATIVMVTHKLSEILDATTRVIVLLDGRLTVDQPTAGLDRQALVRMLVAHESSDALELTQGEPPGEAVMAFDGVHGGAAGPIDLEIRRGEVVGLTGLPGSGLHDIAYLACGAMRPARGRIRMAAGARTAIVPPHRETQGGLGALSVRDNLTLTALRRWRSKARLLDLRTERDDARRLATRLDVQPPDIDGVFDVLSGGNKQKVIFGRAVADGPDLYVLCEPTRGVDVGTRASIYSIIRELRAQRAAILVISSDAEDLFAVCDRIGVVAGAIQDPRPVGEMNPAELEALV